MGILSLLADVVFVGHSLVGPTLPGLVELALKQQGARSVVLAQVINGASLAYNWDHAAEAEGIDARARLTDRAADVLILTEAQPFAAHVKFSFTAANVAKFTALALEANPDTRVYLYETWPSLNSAPGVVVEGDPDAGIPWRERLALDLPLWQGVATEATALAGHDVALIPAGQAMGRLADAIREGQVPGIGSIQEMFADDIHPNGKGLYFLAMLHAGVISGQSPVGLPAKLTRAWTSRDAVMTEEQARVLQQIAWEALQSYVPAKGGAAAATEPAATAAAVASDDPAVPAFAPITNQHLAMNLAGINDWSVQQPFLNVMKTARPWVGHLPGQWGGWTHDDLARAEALSPDGWPLRLPAELTGIATLILTDLPEDAMSVAGRYILTYQGNGTLQLDGRAGVVQAEPGRILFDYTPGEGTVLITLTAIDSADPIRDIVVVREDREQALMDGAIFNPDWLARIRGVKGLRFMDWMATNDSTLSNPADRPKPADYTYARIGAPAEVMVALANDLQADPWFTLPHLATDDFARTYAQIVHDGMAPTLKAHVEYSNEVWNWQFAQARWAEAQGRARWGKESTWVQFYGMRASEIMAVWSELFKDAPDRLVRVVAVQTGWLGLEAQILDAPLLLTEGRSAPANSFDAYAVTGYFSALLGSDAKFVAVKGWLKQSVIATRDEAALQGLKGSKADAYVAAHRFDLAVKLAAQELRDGSVTGDPTDSLAFVLGQILPYHAAIAADRDLRLMMYEGGTHVVGIGSQAEDEELTAFFTHLNYTPELGALYAELLAGWHMLSDAPFNAFVDVNRASKWGSFGMLRHLGDDNPRWQALAKGCLTC